MGFLEDLDAEQRAELAAIDDNHAPQASEVVGLDAIEPWTAYEQRLQILEKFSRLRQTREEVAQTMIVPNISNPGGSFFFEKVPLSVAWKGEPPQEEEPRSYPVNQALNDRVSLWTGDVTALKCDAICIPVMWNFSHDGSGLAALVLSRAGPLLQKDCLHLGTLEVGQTGVTEGHGLPARWVFHTAPPPFRQAHNPYPLLQSCYQTCLDAALRGDRGVRTLAFVCLGTGAKFNQPDVESAHVALRTTRVWLERADHAEQLDRIVFVVKNARQQEIYEQLMRVYFPVRSEAAGPLWTEEARESMLEQLPSPPQ